MFCSILAEKDDSGVAAGAFADFSNHPPGPEIDHRRLYAPVLTRSTSGVLPGLSLTRAGTR
jgi:hypothetical protein